MPLETGSSPLQENSNSVPPVPHFSVPCCNMCARKAQSKAYCQTCSRYLCDKCDFAHKVMVCFQSHQIVSLDHIENVEDLSKALNNDAINDIPTIYDLNVNIREKFKKHFLDGQTHIETTTKSLNDLDKCLENLDKDYSVCLGYINEMCGQYQEYLKNRRDELVASVDEHYNTKQTIIVTRKKMLEMDLANLFFKVSNSKLIIDDENVGGSDHSKQSTNECVSTYFPPTNAASEHCSFENLNSSFENLNSSFFAALTLNTDDCFVDDTTGANTTSGDTIPTEPLNLPVIAPEPRNLKCHVNPDLTLTTYDPACPPSNTTKVNSVQLHKTFGQKGNGSGQFNSPHGFCVGFDEDIVVADSSNHRIQIFNKNGYFKSQFGISGRHDGCLWHPRKVALLPYRRRYVVCDRGYERSRMQIFSEDGTFFKKVLIQFIDIVAGIAITDDEEIVIVDSVTPTVFIIGQDEFFKTIDCSKFMQEPSDIAVLGKEFYICDFKAHNIVVIDYEGNLLRKFGNSRISMYPNGIDVSAAGVVVVGDSHGNFFHIAVYSKEGDLIAEFRCPYIKVSRCCGLKMISEERLVTVDKNYHHIIVLETLCAVPGSY